MSALHWANAVNAHHQRPTANSNTLREVLFVRYQLPDIARLNGRDRRRFAQMSLSLLAFARQDMTFETFVPLDLAAPGHTESLGCSPVGFYFWHVLLLQFSS
jgi:hypothetical protein